MRHISLIVFCAASLAVQNLAAITATKEYVDRKDSATLQEATNTLSAATNTLSAAIGGLEQNLATVSNAAVNAAITNALQDAAK